MPGLRQELWLALSREADAAGITLPARPTVSDPSCAAVAAGLELKVVRRAVFDMLQLPLVQGSALCVPAPIFLEKVPISYARMHGLLGLADDSDRMPVAIRDAAALDVLPVVSRLLRRPVRPVVAGEAELASAIDKAYQQRSGQAQALIESLDRNEVLEDLARVAGREDLLDVDTRAPVIRLVSLILFEAVKLMASDVHVQPGEESVAVRMRVDGVLSDSFQVPQSLREEIISRIKVMGGMNIAEKRLAQDGRATVRVGERTIDLRIATLPTRHGERAVLRLLDKSARLYTLEELGMERATLQSFKQLIASEHGIILVTGPTGSGKTTTLYAALQELNCHELNVLTLEDPIEYGLNGISQTQVSEKKGTTFASGLRNVLRQDPDVIMVGEIRDRETATMAIQSALTGHLVFSTLHTNDAASAVIRLLDLGVEPYLLASSVIGVLAQRLVRQVCRGCSQPPAVPVEELRRLGLDVDPASINSMRIGRGCGACRGTGFRDRRGIFELLVVTDALRRRIYQRPTASDVRTAAVEAGMATLRDDGMRKVLAGTTTMDEVLRVTMRSS